MVNILNDKTYGNQVRAALAVNDHIQSEVLDELVGGDEAVAPALLHWGVEPIIYKKSGHFYSWVLFSSD